MAAKKNDKRVDDFRQGALDFVTKYFQDMEEAFKQYIKDKNYDKAVMLYMKFADKVIPALATQSAETATDEKPAWMNKVEKAKKTIENDTK